MNENKIDCLGLIQQSYGLTGDFDSEFGNDSYTIISRFESPASAFYAAEHCMGFSEYDYQVGNSTNHSLSSQSHKINDLEFPLYQSPRLNHFLDSANQPDPNYEISNTLQAMVKSQLNSNQDNKVSCGDFPGTKFLSIEPQKVLIDGIASVSRSSSSPNKGNQDCMAVPGPSGSAFGNSSSNGTVISSKTRIRWTKDLHEKFVECVNRLGGAEKATPKTILKMMGSDSLTIFHIKSHLQKYRIAKFVPESAQGVSNKRVHTEDVHHLDVKTGLQIREALQLQLDTQRRLHEQLEFQRALQLRIEEQGMQLKKMFDQQQMTSDSLLSTPNTANDDTTISHKDVHGSVSEGASNSFFPSKSFVRT